MKNAASTKGQIVLEVERIDRGEYRLTRLSPPNHGLLDWLLACPEKDFFVHIESEPTDTLR